MDVAESDCVRHRDWELLDVREEEGGEFYLYARCGECGQYKSALVDLTRDWASASAIPPEGVPESVDGSDTPEVTVDIVTQFDKRYRTG